MSDLQDIIARNGVMAFNSGYQEGQRAERDRIIAILEKIKDYECRCSCDCHDEFPPCITCQAHNEVVEMIRGEK